MLAPMNQNTPFKKFFPQNKKLNLVLKVSKAVLKKTKFEYFNIANTDINNLKFWETTKLADMLV